MAKGPSGLIETMEKPNGEQHKGTINDMHEPSLDFHLLAGCWSPPPNAKNSECGLARLLTASRSKFGLARLCFAAAWLFIGRPRRLVTSSLLASYWTNLKSLTPSWSSEDHVEEDQREPSPPSDVS